MKILIRLSIMAVVLFNCPIIHSWDFPWRKKSPKNEVVIRPTKQSLRETAGHFFHNLKKDMPTKLQKEHTVFSDKLNLSLISIEPEQNHCFL